MLSLTGYPDILTVFSFTPLYDLCVVSLLHCTLMGYAKNVQWQKILSEKFLLALRSSSSKVGVFLQKRLK